MPGSDLNETAENPGLPGYQSSPLLAGAGFRHAFFTRLGGVSEGPFESLSFSTAVGDDPSRVDENLRRAAALLGVDAANVLYLSQVHGREALFYRTTERRENLITLQGDAIGGTSPRAAYGVRSADCIPILVADQTSGAVMAIHAGWRGVVAGVIEAGVARLREGIGSPGHLLAAIGPHISRAAFEVSDEVAAELQAVSAAAPAIERRPDGARPHVDLRLIATHQLLGLGLAAGAIDQVGGCTVLDPHHYFSFRRDGKRSGRHLSAIVPRSEATTRNPACRAAGFDRC
ncbi:MAG TPA: polyphenol oxidase family protein [Polyangiaceae bacterium]|nr:polyphenol oxidase family protein [Polyangiaceae bacterium]